MATEERTQTSAFGVGRREGHDASAFYARFTPPELSADEVVNRPESMLRDLGRGRIVVGDSADMSILPDASVALVVTSPPYFVGKEYELAVTGEDGAADDARIPQTYLDFLDMLRRVFRECRRVLEPGGRIAVNVANLGRKPYRSLSADVIGILQDDLGLLLRGEIVWEKSATSSGSCAWGSFAKASNPVLRDMTERVIVASKGRFARALDARTRQRRSLPGESTLTNDEFVEVTRDVWRIDAESATRVGHPAPFPVELPRRLIELFTFTGDVVVDPFAGSGSTVVAAARTGRVGVGYDLDPEYAALAQRRLDDELAHVDERDERFARLTAAPPGEQAAAFAALTADDRQEYLQRRAVADGKRAADIARAALETAGFTGIVDTPKAGVATFDLAATDAIGAPWLIALGGAFTTTKPGLQRSEIVWRLLAQMTVLAATTDGARDGAVRPRVLVLTPSRPRPTSPAGRALAAAVPAPITDVIELYDPAGADRLRIYASGLERRSPR